MKDLKNLGLTELNTSDIKTVNGGFNIIDSVVSGAKSVGNNLANGFNWLADKLWG